MTGLEIGPKGQVRLNPHSRVRGPLHLGQIISHNTEHFSILNLGMLGTITMEGRVRESFIFCHFKDKKTKYNTTPIRAPRVITQLPMKKGLFKKIS